MRIKKFKEYSINENADNYDIEEVHISDIVAGDTIEHDGEVKTVTSKDIKPGGFMGTSIFGDSYKSGNKLVKKIIYKTKDEN